MLGGRSEILVSIKAIMDSPIIGYGSWAKSLKYALEKIYMLRQLGIRATFDPSKAILLPTHSHLFGAWVEAGIIGGVFWIWVISVWARAAIGLAQLKDRIAPLLAFVVFLVVWDILFSPFGAERRFIMPYYIIVIMWIVNEARGRKPRVGSNRKKA